MNTLRKVQIILFRKQEQLEFLLLKRSGANPIWQGITGGVEELDKNLKSAAVRELFEELGITAAEENILGPFHEFEFQTDRKGYEGTIAHEYCYAFEILSPYNFQLSEEHNEFRWLPFEEAIRLVDFENPKIVMRKVKESIK